MATTLTARLALAVLAEMGNTSDLAPAAGALTVPVTSLSPTNVFKNGTGTNQADKIFSDSRQIAASTTDTLDLAGGSLSDPFGVALTFVKLKAIVVAARSTNNIANNVVVTRPASNGVPIFSAAGDACPLHPGSFFVATWPGAGLTVTAGTGDLIDIANSAGTNAVDYDVVLIGTSA